MYNLEGEYDRLRDYQLDCVTSIFTEFNNGAKSSIAVLPMGSGKTIIVGAIIKRYLDRHPYKRAVMLSHLDVLTRQNEESIREFWGINTGILQAHRIPKSENRCIISTMQSFKVAEKMKQWGHLDSIGLCIVDETHLFGSTSYDSIVASLPKDCLLLGVTATPFRENKDMTSMFDSVAYTISMQELIDKKMLVPPVLHHIPIRREEEDESIFIKLIKIYTAKHNGEKSLIFMKTIKQCEELANMFRVIGVNATAVTSKFTGEKRHECIDDFKENELNSADILITVGVLTAGFSSNNVRSIFMPFNVSSVAAYLQRIGRGMRLDEGKTHCDVYVGGPSPKLTHEQYEKLQKTALNAGRPPEELDRELPTHEQQYDANGIEYSNATIELSKELNKAGFQSLSVMIRQQDFPEELLNNLTRQRRMEIKSLQKYRPRLSETQFLERNGMYVDGMSRLDAVHAISAVLESRGVHKSRLYIPSGKYEGAPYAVLNGYYMDNFLKPDSKILKGRLENTKLYSQLDTM